MLLHEEADALGHDTGPLPSQLLPPTVQAVIAARIDHLPGNARDVVRKASVFARSTFDVTELGLIAHPDEEVLAVLEDEELLLRDEERPGVWRFRHGIVRDVAYDSLPKRERQRLHLLVANKLVEDADVASRNPRRIAYHLEQAARASLDLNPSDRSTAVRAVESLSHAGDLALAASEARSAADLYARALSLSGPERTWGLSEAITLSNLGESRYWLGEFESAIAPLQRALELGGEDTRVRSHACRFLGDIELSIRGDRERAGELFDRALAAARELGDPWSLARTLLVAGWAPYWRSDIEGARAMFEEALAVTRANPEGDPWSEARALGALATIVSETGDEEESLALASQALAIGESTGDRFAVAVAREGVGNSLRRLWRLEEAHPHLDLSVEAFRELGARWELASALTSRGVARRLSGRTEEAVKDLREAYRLCRELKERSLLTWTASSLAKAFVDAGELDSARRVLEETAAVASPDGPGPGEWLLDAETVLLLAEGDEEGARGRALELLHLVQARGWPKEVAAQVLWIGRLFGADAAGGEEELARGRKVVEETHWEQALRAPSPVREG
jgi:tetratricopeptide (TPR) repeat protein